MITATPTRHVPEATPVRRRGISDRGRGFLFTITFSLLVWCLIGWGIATLVTMFLH